jgi:hypothetical protein
VKHGEREGEEAGGGVYPERSGVEHRVKSSSEVASEVVADDSEETETGGCCLSGGACSVGAGGAKTGAADALDTGLMPPAQEGPNESG